jgi:uncharacterized protein YneF (UPF0154 family)
MSIILAFALCALIGLIGGLIGGLILNSRKYRNHG